MREENWAAAGLSWNCLMVMEIHFQTGVHIVTHHFNCWVCVNLKKKLLWVFKTPNWCLCVCVCVWRTYELQVNGGTPYEKNVTVEASMAKGCKHTQPRSAQSRLNPEKMKWLYCIWVLLYCMNSVIVVILSTSFLFQLQQACLSRSFKPAGSPCLLSSWNQQTARSERSWGESISILLCSKAG